MRLSLLTTAFLTSIVLADVQFTTPSAGAIIPGGGSLSIAWGESGSSPAISDLTTYQLFLCAGGNDEASIVQLETITTQGTFANGNQAMGTVPLAMGASTPANSYFLKIISVSKNGGTVTNYSPRFTLSGMSGVFPAAVVTGMKTVTGTTGPSREVTVAAPAAGDGAFNEPYAMQSGPIIYAPMLSYPGTKVTKSKKTPLYPTSAYVLATTYLPANPAIQTTVTQPVTWAFTQRENPAAAASQPTDPMQRFLNRWKD